MRRLPFTTIREPQTSREALKIIGTLRNAGLHPAALRSTTPLVLPGQKPRFPVKVSKEEVEAAKKLLKSLKTRRISKNLSVELDAHSSKKEG